MKTEIGKCPNCGTTCESYECQKCGWELGFEGGGSYDDEDDFQPCSDCDGHDACADFGCAVKAGLGHLLQKPL